MARRGRVVCRAGRHRGSTTPAGSSATATWARRRTIPPSGVHLVRLGEYPTQPDFPVRHLRRVLSRGNRIETASPGPITTRGSINRAHSSGPHPLASAPRQPVR